METIRAFIAVELPDIAKNALSQIQDRLKAGRHPYIKWVSPEGIHLTLKFLGNIDSCKATPVAEAITQAARGIPPLRLELGETGAFPNARRPRVIWVAVKGDVEMLATLQKRIDQLLVPLNFIPEARPFSPHLTLGRLKDMASPDERQRIGESLAAVKPVPVPFQASEVSLMRSVLTPSGAIYSRLSGVPLEGVGDSRKKC